jgi:predicted house-cleaning noncanonical NTP pyrophosphatase (MazG superfamily)
MRNKPPYTITEKAADYLAKIVETVTRLEYGTGFKEDVQLKHQDKHQDELTDVQEKILRLLEVETLSRKEIFVALGLSSDSRAFKRHMKQLLDANLIEMTLPDKPNSKLQKYRRVDN